jgi:uncharacterized protein (DUF4415 family)
MLKKSNIVRYSAEEIAARIAAGEDRTNWDKLARTTSAEIEMQAAADGDILREGWEQTAIMGLPPRKEPINLRIDADILDWFRQSGKGYQTRINNVLRAFVDSRRG